MEDGSTILTSGSTAFDGGAAGGGGGGNPSGADAAIAAALLDQGRPEYIDEKFWDPEKKTARVEDLGRSYQSLQKLLGSEKAPVVTNWDDPEQRERWYKAAGRPESPDKYEFKRPDQIPKGLSYDEDLEKDFRTWAHVNGYNQWQASQMYEKFVSRAIDKHVAWEKSREEDKARVHRELQREYGNQTEARVNEAKSILQQYADPDFYTYLNETGQGNDLRMIRFLTKVARDMGEDRRLKGGGPTQIPQAEDVDKAIANFRGKYGDGLKSPLMDKNHPDHDQRVREFNSLFEKRYGNAPVR
jgi:hypothetical protein